MREDEIFFCDQGGVWWSVTKEGVNVWRKRGSSGI